ncbi:MAG: hypothetical protein HY731_13045 [Candidatus Tectomicrobia bacterium]|nr:hypothetical protein [Candidatus Tectomicrobia bacterium]
MKHSKFVSSLIVILFNLALPSIGLTFDIVTSPIVNIKEEEVLMAQHKLLPRANTILYTDM